MLDIISPRSSKLDFDRLHTAIATLRSKQIFFVGGGVRSGTTWLQLLLDAHPEVSCNGEAHFIDYLAPSLKQTADHYREYIDNKNRTIFRELEGYPLAAEEDFQYLMASWIALLLIRQSKCKEAVAVGERTPNNIDHFDMLDVLFPAAKFIHIVRDGRDSAVSAWLHNLRVTPDWAMQQYSSLATYATGFAESWAKHIARAQQFAERHPDRFLRIRYEDLAAETERSLASLFGFIGVGCDEAVLARCRNDASFVKLSGGRNPGQENRGSFFRKGVTGDWRNHLSIQIEAEFRKRAGGWLERLGYYW